MHHILEELKHLDVEDRKRVKSYNNTRKRKVRKYKNLHGLDVSEYLRRYLNEQMRKSIRADAMEELGQKLKIQITKDDAEI